MVGHPMEPVRVSDLAQYHYCPRRVYFHHRGHDVVTKARCEALFLRELSMRLPYTTLDGDRLRSTLEDIHHCFHDIFPDVRAPQDLVDSAYEVIWNGLDELLRGALEDVESNGPWKPPEHEEYYIESDRLGLSGVVDKLYEYGPCVIRSGAPPSSGVWRLDRLRVAAYAMLLEDELGSRVDEGTVEYIRYGVRRRARIWGKDRRLVLRTRDRVHRIYDGEMPEAMGESCDTCSYAGLCGVEVKTLASHLE